MHELKLYFRNEEFPPIAAHSNDITQQSWRRIRVLAVSKRFAATARNEAGSRRELHFAGFDYPRIAAISG